MLVNGSVDNGGNVCHQWLDRGRDQRYRRYVMLFINMTKENCRIVGAVRSQRMMRVYGSDDVT